MPSLVCEEGVQVRSLNNVKIVFQAQPENVGFARVAVACIASQRDDLTLDVLEDIKLVVSEAVSNAIIHGVRQRSEQIRYS